jgi:hypothetical protein
MKILRIACLRAEIWTRELPTTKDATSGDAENVWMFTSIPLVLPDGVFSVYFILWAPEPCEISDSYDGEYEDDSLLGSCAV